MTPKTMLPKNKPAKGGKLRLSITQKIMFGFMAIILIGGTLLCLPISSRAGTFTPFLDSVFTATSATCVTGLVVYDTYLHWSVFGQCVIISLIQIGGLGFMTVATLFSMILRRRIGLSERELLREGINSVKVGGIVRFARHILIGTFAIEAAGAVALSFRFIPELGVLRGIYDSIFLSVSAFCNAGFDLMGYHGAFSSLTAYADDPLVSMVIPLLILSGGLGFLVWDDLILHRFNVRRCGLQTKLVLTMTMLLVVIPVLLMLITETQLAEVSSGGAFLRAFFQTVTPRTAGFNTMDLTSLRESTILLMIVLMFVGGSSGSTAGGVKTTTVAVLFLAAKAAINRRGDLTAYNRRLERDILSRCTGICLFYLVLALGGAFLLCASDGVSVRDAIFETFSAMSTTGLSLGLTPTLGGMSRVTLTLLMYLGRVGSLTVAFALAQNTVQAPIKFPEEKISVG